MGEDKITAILATGAEVLTSADTSCLLHLGGLLSRRRASVKVMHLAAILAISGAEA
jgi:L-lactate dehydrogenase complex protein LldE